MGTVMQFVARARRWPTNTTTSKAKTRAAAVEPFSCSSISGLREPYRRATHLKPT